MKNADIIRKRLDSIKGEGDLSLALSELADIEFEIGLDACKERKLIREHIKDLRVVLLGNGNPSNSLMVRLEKVEDCVSSFTIETKSDIEEINNAINGKGDEPGILERLRVNQKFNNDLVKLKWMVLAMILAEIINVIKGLL